MGIKPLTSQFRNQVSKCHVTSVRSQLGIWTLPVNGIAWIIFHCLVCYTSSVVRIQIPPHPGFYAIFNRADWANLSIAQRIFCQKIQMSQCEAESQLQSGNQKNFGNSLLMNSDESETRSGSVGNFICRFGMQLTVSGFRQMRIIQKSFKPHQIKFPAKFLFSKNIYLTSILI